MKHLSPTPDFLPPFTGWAHPSTPRRRHLDRNGWHDPAWCLAKATPGPDWAALDDALQRTVGPHTGPLDTRTGYRFVPKRYAEALAAEFTRLAAADRLELRLLPAAPAGQPTLDGRTLR